MKVRIDRSFEKDTDRIKDRKLLARLAECIREVMAAESLSDVPNLKKMNGFKEHYRIRVGDYRIGLRLDGSEVIFERFLSRKDIYRYFPK
jgi:mRNA interferase RelE/StbE